MRITIDDFIDIAATPEAVWALFQEIESWPRWNRTLSHAGFLQGVPWTPDSVFTMTARLGPASLTALVTIDSADPPRTVAWRGARFGVRSHHVWNFLPWGEGARVHSRETFTGLTLPLLWVGGMPFIVSYLSNAWLRGLKAEAEGRKA